MRRLISVASLLLLTVAVRGADDLLTMELSARADSQPQQIAHGQPASSAATAPRPAVSVKAKTRLRLQWSVVNADKTARLTDVTVHLVLDKPGSDAAYESAFLMDFAPQARSTGDVFVQAPPQAGDYQLRLETIGAAKVHGHEHVAAMNVKVVP